MNNYKTTVIIPTTGSAELKRSIESVLNQTEKTLCYVVCDGEKFANNVGLIVQQYQNVPNFKICYLPENVGSKGFYGHRIYAAFSHLVNTEYVCFLDQDVYFDINHVQSCIDNIESNNLDWTYSLRKICDKDGNHLLNDDCESLGKWPVFSGEYRLIDTNNYCIKTSVLKHISQAWHGGWGQDRVFFETISHHFKNFSTTGKYTVNYCLGGNDGSVKASFFQHGNKIMNQKYKGVFPWRI
jgi:glycosyltransferase involved in cell wall biosynthesis